MTDLAKLAEALEDKPDSDGHCREAAALFRAAAGADVQVLMRDAENAVERYWDAAYAEGVDGAKHDTPSGEAQKAIQGVKDAHKALETALRLALPVWRPIEEAPKDGTMVLYWSAAHGYFAGNEPENHYRGRWTNYGDKWGGDAYFAAREATHWTPLPPQPKGQP